MNIRSVEHVLRPFEDSDNDPTRANRERAKDSKIDNHGAHRKLEWRYFERDITPVKKIEPLT